MIVALLTKYCGSSCSRFNLSLCVVVVSVTGDFQYMNETENWRGFDGLAGSGRVASGANARHPPRAAIRRKPLGFVEGSRIQTCLPGQAGGGKRVTHSQCVYGCPNLVVRKHATHPSGTLETGKNTCFLFYRWFWNLSINPCLPTGGNIPGSARFRHQYLPEKP